jgi:hypothetical protein
MRVKTKDEGEDEQIHWTPDRMNDIAMRQLSSIHAQLGDLLLPAVADFALK